MNFSRKTKISSEIPTSSMPDIIFMLLIFFMVTTVLREQTILVEQKIPQATQLQKIQKKTLISLKFGGPSHGIHRIRFFGTNRLKLL